MRLLFIGNIANNSYLNAKILRNRGVEADVICPDYYHVMSYPEWEEGDFTGDLGDHARPDWSSVQLHGPDRPEWFAQGRLHTCIEYLLAYRREDKAAAARWRAALSVEARLSQPCHKPALAERLRSILANLAEKRRVFARYRWAWIAAVTLICTALMILVSPAKIAAPVIVLGLMTILATRKSLSYLRIIASPILSYRSYRRLGRAYRRNFPTRSDRFHLGDIAGVLRYASLKPLMEYYDIVVGCSVEGFYPLLLGKRPYCAYEHGTLRNIPFSSDSQGRRCALSYKLADVSFITNCDNITAAEKLQLDNYRFVPHPINEDAHPDVAAAGLRSQLLQDTGSNFIVFHPARQHWQPQRHPDWEKGNDIFIKGFARFVREVNDSALAIFVEWGECVQQSKELLASLGAASNVRWIPPQPNVRMITYIKAADLLADQFYLGAFGSTTPKALLHGCPAMSYIDRARHTWCFPETPPIISANTPEDVFEGLKRVYQDAEYRRELIDAGRQWYSRYHSNDAIANIFLETFREIACDKVDSNL